MADTLPPRPVAAPAPDQSDDKIATLRKYESMIVDIRSRRMPIDEAWLRFHAAYLGQAVRQQYTGGTFSHYIPAARRAIERFVSRLVEMLTPSSAFFEVYPMDEYGDQAGKKAESVWRYLLYLLTKKIKVGDLIRQLGRTFNLYGRAITKFGVRIDSSKPTGPEVWPTLRAVDPFCFYAWPETENDLDEVVLCFEDVFMPWEKFNEIAIIPACKTEVVPQESLTNPTWPSSYMSRLSRKAFTEPSATSSGQSDASKNNSPVRFVELTEMWAREGGKWVMRWIVWNYKGGPKIVREQESPFGRHPYRWALSRQLPGEQFTVGMMDDLEPLNVALNDQVNMTMEGQAVAMSPPTVVDPNVVSRPNSITFKPRARWYADPQGVKVLEVPDTTRSGITGINMFLGFIDSFSGSNPLAEGSPSRNMPRAGFAVSSLLNLSLADIRDVAKILEDNLMTPSLGDLYRLTVSLVPKTQTIRIPGTQGMSLLLTDPKALNGDWEFNWVGSIQAQDYQVRAQRLITTLGVIMKGFPVLNDQLAAGGKKLHLEALFKRIWRDGLGERGADSIIVPMDPQEVERYMAMKDSRPQPKVNVSLRGELDPLTARALADGDDPHKAVPPQPASGTNVGGPTPGVGLPTSGENVETSVGRSLGNGGSSGPPIGS